MCRDLQVVVVDSLDKHFVSESDLVHILKKADLNPIKRPMDEINTDRIENELLKNEMIARVEADPAFGLTREEIEAELSPEDFTGRAPQQVEEFLAEVIRPVLDANKEDLGQHVELNV